MALVKCPDCGREVSDAAPTCPECGKPLKAQTIERTGKKWKSVIVVGALAAIIGTIVLVAGVTDESAAAIAAGVIVLLTGITMTLVGRIGAWWFHG